MKAEGKERRRGEKRREEIEGVEKTGKEEK